MTWDNIWKEHGDYMCKPDENILESIPRFKKEGRILDLGCGAGRHSFPLLKNGFFVTSMDCSSHCLELLRAKARRFEPRLNIVKSSFSGIPFPDAYFDGVLCNNAVHHELLKNIKLGLNEIHRVLKNNGLLILTTLSDKDPHTRKGVEIEPNTFTKIPNWKDGDCPHHLFSEAELRYLLRNFEILQFDSLVEKIDGYRGLISRWKILAKKKQIS